jgi:hypothetical protein
MDEVKTVVEKQKADPVISLKKGGWMLVQTAAGFLSAVGAAKAQSTIGVQIDPNVTTPIYMAIFTAIIHSAVNFFKHKFQK